MKRLTFCLVALLAFGGMIMQMGWSDKRQKEAVFAERKPQEVVINEDVVVLTALETKHVLTNLKQEFQTILEQSARDFFAGYSINESFLLWINAQFGDDAIKTIAHEVEAGNADSAFWYELTGKSIHVLWLEYCKSLNYSSYLLSNVSWIECSSQDEIVIDFIGDINFGENWHTTNALDENGGSLTSGISEEILSELSSADIAMANNEFTLSLRGEKTKGKAYLFRADPSRASYYEQMGVDIVSLANNHTWDYGEEALLDTIDTLDENGIIHVGAGKNLNEAKGIHYFVANGKKIAVVSATQIERYSKYTKEATEDSAGVLKTLEPEIFLSVIEEAKVNSDYVIAYVHWGTEGHLYPDEDVRTLAKQYVAAGADIIVGGHPHRLQGIRYFSDVPVLYSLGNFWFSTGDLYTTIAQIRIDGKGNTRLFYLPCEQKNLNVSLLTNQEEKDGFYEYLADLSGNIGITEDGEIKHLSDDESQNEENMIYRSKMSYRDWHGDEDLEGNGIDIVGNLK